MNLVPGVGFFELVVLAILALVVVGPKELPRLMRMLGSFVGQARRMAGEFRAAFDQMARETELEEMRKEIEALKHDNAIVAAKREVDDALRPVEALAREEADALRNEMTKTVGDPP